MDPLEVTIISCLYGRSHDEFLEDWLGAIRRLNPSPSEVILATDRVPFIPDVYVITHRNHDWQWPQAYYLNVALDSVETDWIWQVDIDDLPFPDALVGGNHAADVVQVGFIRSDGEEHLPKAAGPLNQYVAGSFIRTSAIREVGGFRDVEHQDSDLWERLLAAGAIFSSADRPRFHYRRHAQARTAREAA